MALSQHTCCPRQCVHCIVPPYLFERLARSRQAALRKLALANLVDSTRFRTERKERASHPPPQPLLAAPAQPHRQVHDARGHARLPGRLVRAEGQPAGRDPAVNEAYDHSGTVWQFYSQVFGRNSLDNRGLPLVSSVHVAAPDGGALDNAFWDGHQMAYGDGDGQLFQRFTRSLDVVAHELTHGVQAYTSNLEYHGQSGALNEHFSDVFGILVRQWQLRQPAREASWLIGAEVLLPIGDAAGSRPPYRRASRRAIRDMLEPGSAYKYDPIMGSDPQPAHLSKLYSGPLDNGGVHLNSGIPNRAFALTALALGGNAWETAGAIWFDTLLGLGRQALFADCARATVLRAARDGAAARRAVIDAWQAVGLVVN